MLGRFIVTPPRRQLFLKGTEIMRWFAKSRANICLGGNESLIQPGFQGRTWIVAKPPGVFVPAGLGATAVDRAAY